METSSESAQSLSGASSAESYPPTITRKFLEIKEKKKFHSCQDLRPKYNRNRYQHVNSKVKEYIASIQNQDRRRKKICKSVPETLDEFENIDIFNDTPKTELINQIEKKSKIQNEILKQDYQTLERNFEEKQIVISKLKRDLDTLKYELRKEKEKNSKSSSLFKNRDRMYKIMISKSTQTDAVVSLEENLAVETDSDSDVPFLMNSNPDESINSSNKELKPIKKNTKLLEKKRKFKNNFWSQFAGCFGSRKGSNECSYVLLSDGK